MSIFAAVRYEILPRFYELDYQEPGCRRSTNGLLREVL